uniref:Ras-associating domain-containing protein n=1 Tax=Gouania willdenowi TaxID=441366 RepID=A0A8C5EPH9_GOUWI
MMMMMVEPEEGKVSVWVCREEKLVSGLTKRTTCSDVSVSAKWRGFERILPNKTKILRLWSAWGDEQENVRFVLVKNEASLPNNGPRSAEARVVPTSKKPFAAIISLVVIVGLDDMDQNS